jgi:hypothetical protein
MVDRQRDGVSTSAFKPFQTLHSGIEHDVWGDTL